MEVTLFESRYCAWCQYNADVLQALMTAQAAEASGARPLVVPNNSCTSILCPKPHTLSLYAGGTPGLDF